MCPGWRKFNRSDFDVVSRDNFVNLFFKLVWLGFLSFLNFVLSLRIFSIFCCSQFCLMSWYCLICLCR